MKLIEHTFVMCYKVLCDIIVEGVNSISKLHDIGKDLIIMVHLNTLQGSRRSYCNRHTNIDRA